MNFGGFLERQLASATWDGHCAKNSSKVTSKKVGRVFAFECSEKANVRAVRKRNWACVVHGRGAMMQMGSLLTSLWILNMD